MKVSDFIRQYPQAEIDFSRPIQVQARIYDTAALDPYPMVLEAEFPYSSGSRGRPNPNQTLAHSQCATCHRVLRNDMFYTLPSMMKRNQVFSHCRECNQGHNAIRYELRADLIRSRRTLIWEYIAPRCAICGFDQHMSAMDFHHPENKESYIAELITAVTLTVDFAKVEALFREAAKCTPLCSNCHRMLHAGALDLPNAAVKPSFKIAELLGQLKALE